MSPVKFMGCESGHKVSQNRMRRTWWIRLALPASFRLLSMHLVLIAEIHIEPRRKGLVDAQKQSFLGNSGTGSLTATLCKLNVGVDRIEAPKAFHQGHECPVRACGIGTSTRSSCRNRNAVPNMIDPTLFHLVRLKNFTFEKVCL